MFVADVKCSQATWQTVPNSKKVWNKLSYMLEHTILLQMLPRTRWLSCQSST